MPLIYYHQDLHLRSGMIEVRRGLYCDESTGEPLLTFAALRDAITVAVRLAIDDPAD